MAVAIRLSRLGKKDKPFYRIIVTDSRKKRDGRYLEKIGDYNPFIEKNKININQEKFEAWIKKGAVISKGLSRLLKNYSFKKG